MKRLAFLFIFLMTILFWLRPMDDMNQDLGRHLKVGEIIATTWQIPQTKLMAYTYPSYHAGNNPWLAEVVMYLLVQTIGVSGLYIFFILLFLFAFGLVLFSIRDKPIPVILFVSCLVLGIMWERMSLRPELFSYLFFSIFLVVLYANKKHFTKWIYILPFIEMLWVNMHIYFFLGIGLVGLFFIDACVTHWKSVVLFLKAKSSLPKKVTQLIILGVLIVIGACINPSWVYGALYPFLVLNGYYFPIGELSNTITLQFYSTFLTVIFFDILAILSIILFFAYRKKIIFIDLLVALFVGLFGSLMIRNIVFFAFGMIIPFTHLLEHVYEKTKTNKSFQIILSSISVLGMIFFLSFSINNVGFGFTVPAKAEKAVNFLIKNNVSGPLFNSFDIGSYLEYRFYPKQLVFVDTRPEAYPAVFFKNIYLPMQEDTKIFTQVDNQYHFNVIFYTFGENVGFEDTFLSSIAHNSQFKLVYIDDYAIVFVRNTPQNQTLIKKYEITDTNFTPPAFTNAANFLKLSNFFNYAGWGNAYTKTLQTILNHNPNYCPALYNLSQVYSQQNLPIAPVYLSKYQQSCR